MCVLLEESIALSPCETNGIYRIYCSESPTRSPPRVYCDIFSPVNATALRNRLTTCSVGETYRSITLVYRDLGESELQLDLGDSINSLFIRSYNGHQLYINPLKQHTNITSLEIYTLRWETHDLVVSEYFPNLEELIVREELSITTIDNNLLSNLTYLNELTWKSSSLVNVSDDSFIGLSSLTQMDLNYNNISYLSSEAFEHLPSLEVLSVIGGQLTCTCQLQWMSIVDTNGWVDIVGDCDGSGLSVDSPSTYSQCHNTESYQCFNKSISCENVCINTPSSYVCACDAGYGLTLLEAEDACHDIDECVQNVAICQGQSCRNTLGSYECYCSAGFVSGAGGDTCVDVDECSFIPCEHNCTNTMGSYWCSCLENFVLEEEGHICECESGYNITADRSECVAVDECSSSPCEHNCMNTMGSYWCSCLVNFVLEEEGHMCVCESGYNITADRSECVAVDECSSSPCEHNCMNTMGSYWCSCLENFVLEEEGHMCACESGYNITADRSECVDVDECMTENGGCDSICVNTAGGYTCTLSVADNSVSVTFMVTSVLLAIALITVTLVWMITCVGCICYRNKLRSQPENDSQPKVSKDMNYTIFGSDEKNRHVWTNSMFDVPPHYLNSTN